MYKNISLGATSNSCGKAVIFKPNTTEEKIAVLVAVFKSQMTILKNEIENENIFTDQL